MFLVVAAFVPLEDTEAATFQMQTGYYIGDLTDNRTITGLGFQPNLVMIKDDTAAGNEGVVFKTSSMAGELSLALAETDAVLSTNHIQSLDADGFTIGNDTDVNSANVMHHWVAFGGSDCSASGTFCVGSYVGNGTSQNLTSVGFQPDFVAVKRSGATAGAWMSSSMPANNTNFFDNVAVNTAGQMIQSLTATGFNIGNAAQVNTNANTYYFFAFKEVADAMDVGTYTGNAADNRNITSANDAGLTFRPNFVLVKNANAATAVPAVGNVSEHYGDRSFLFTDAASAANHIQDLRAAGGFQVGTTSNTNGSGNTLYYAAFGGAEVKEPGSGTFEMTTGSYTGTGAFQDITGVGFAPDLVVIKHHDQATDQYAVWKSRTEGSTSTHYFANAVTGFTGAITSLTSDGFQISTNATVNTLGDTYYWTAFGNAMRPDKAGGSADFLIGAYVGTGVDSSDVRRLPIDPDFVAMKQVGTAVGVWRPATVAGDLSLYFNAAVAAANLIQALNVDGFQRGTSTSVNGSGSTYHYFAFAEGTRFDVGTYNGNGAARDITSVGFQPDHLWFKKASGGTARAAVLRTSAQIGDVTQPFLNVATIAGAVTNLLAGGFSLGTAVEVNENTFAYHYAAWDAKNYTQAAYRFFANADSADVGASLAVANTPADLVGTGNPFRLRMLVAVDDGNLYASGENFKLQYAAKGAGTCAAPGAPAVYEDVTAVSAIAYNDNGSVADGVVLIGNTGDPVDGGRQIVDQSYEEGNNFTNAQGAVTKGTDGMWDFALIDNGAPAETTYCLRIVKSSGGLLDTYTVYPEITTAAGGGGGTLLVDIVDGSGDPVAVPTMAMAARTFSFSSQTSTGIFGTLAERIRIDNGTLSPAWSMSIAPTAGANALWQAAGASYDFNDPTANAADGGDTDSYGGQLTIDPSGATITPGVGCTTNNLVLGSSAAFDQGVTNSINLLTAGGGADANCFFDLTDVDISQTIPAAQGAGSYELDFTLTVVAI